jgi:integrase
MKQRGVFEKAPGSGVWWVRHVDAQGRLRREKGGTKSSALALYRKRKTEALEGRKLPEKLRRPPVSFGELAREALTHSKAHKRTYSDDVRLMKRVLGWFGDRSAESITPQEIERHFQNGVEEHGWAPSTVNHHRSLISLVYQLGIRNGRLTNNPARATKHRKEDNTRVRFLSTNEEARLRAAIAAKWPQHIAELDLALHTGLRRSEMYRLDWEDVDLPRQFLKVRVAKNGQGRHVRLNSIAVKALLQMQGAGDGSGAVVRNRAGGAMRGPRHWFEKAVDEAGVENFHWHDLRHTFASRLAMAGVGIRAIQEALGHKSIAMTVRYSHLSPDFLQDAVDKLVPQLDEPQAMNPTDTRSDTDAAVRSKPHRGNVH